MTARIVRRGTSRVDWHAALWRLLLAAIALAVVWLALSSAAAAQPPQLPIPALPKFPAATALEDLRPDRLMDQWMGGGKDNAEMDTRLAKVEVGWEEESKLGQQVFDGLRQRLDAQSIRLTERGKDVQYLQRLVAIVQPQMRQAERYRKIQLIVADSDLPNAYSIPGGRLVFTRGMLNQAGSEAAVVCVLGHELAHLDRGHLLRRLKLWKLANIETSPAGVLTFDRMREQMGTLSQLFLRPFRPEEELEADRDGATWCYGAGYDPKTLEQVYAAMDRAGVSSPAFLPAFMRSHPLTADRLENLRTTLAGLETAQPRADLYLGRQNLLQRLTRAQREFNE